MTHTTGWAMKARDVEGFGRRLAEIRKSRGLTQTELGEKVGVSKRVIVYYETESSQPPGAMLVDLARALGTSTDELLGARPVPERTSPKRARLLKKLEQVADLPAADQQVILKMLDTLLENRNLRQAS